MFKRVALWSAPKPEDRAGFEAAYRETHVPLARALTSLSSPSGDVRRRLVNRSYC